MLDPQLRPLLSHLQWTDLTLVCVADLHRPVLVQRLLLLPVLGAVLSNTLLNETIFGKGIAGVFSPQHPPEPWVLHEMWQVRLFTSPPDSIMTGRGESQGALLPVGATGRIDPSSTH